MDDDAIKISKADLNFLKNFQESAHYLFGARGSQDGIWDWNLTENNIYFSARWKKIIGYEDEEIGQDPNEWFKRVHPDDLPHLNQAIDLHFTGVEPFLSHEIRMIHKTSDFCWVLVRGQALFDTKGQAIRFSGTMTDLTVQKNREERLIRNAFYDSLTGLSNRGLFLDRLHQALLRRREENTDQIAIFFVDIDYFKEINDKFGHHAGDELLKGVAKRLETICRTEDTLCRYGGDEFTILIQHIGSLEEVEKLAQRVLKNAKVPFKLGKNEVNVTISMGIAISDHSHSRPEDILQDGDFALYQAKAAGRNQYKIFDDSMRRIMINQDKLESSLEIALDQHQIIMHYQPIVDLRTGLITGFESLMRWYHPIHGLILPDTFLPIAENHELITWLGDYGILEACKNLKTLQKELSHGSDWFVSINISAYQLNSPQFIKNIRAMLKKAQLNSSALRLEFTESALSQNPNKSLETIEALRQFNIMSDLDNFGQGASSFKILINYPFKTIKVDRNLVFSGTKDSIKVEKIFNSLKDLSKSLDFDIVIQGIETKEQYQKVKDMGFTHGQGFYFTKPLPFDDLKTLITTNPVWS
ncbi:MAG: putative bifunctional diguanylate cyclase/phosphodiesterase [Janthinobacterium lividum]